MSSDLVDVETAGLIVDTGGCFTARLDGFRQSCFSGSAGSAEGSGLSRGSGATGQEQRGCNTDGSPYPVGNGVKLFASLDSFWVDSESCFKMRRETQSQSLGESLGSGCQGLARATIFLLQLIFFGLLFR